MAVKRYFSPRRAPPLQPHHWMQLNWGSGLWLRQWFVKQSSNFKYDSVQFTLLSLRKDINLFFLSQLWVKQLGRLGSLALLKELVYQKDNSNLKTSLLKSHTGLYLFKALYQENIYIYMYIYVEIGENGRKICLMVCLLCWRVSTLRFCLNAKISY